MYNESLLYWYRQLELERKIYPSDHPHVAESLKFIGNIHLKMDEHIVALTYLQQALNIYEKTFSKNHDDVKQILIDISLVETALQNRSAKTDMDRHTPKPELVMKFWH
jgi:tetratricopeptide (TPR) repeat protein